MRRGGSTGGLVLRHPTRLLMLNGTYNPGQLVIVLEILTGHGAGDVDTARYLGNQADYDSSCSPTT